MDFAVFMHRPDTVANSLKTSIVPFNDEGVPSVNTIISSAKLRCVNLSDVQSDVKNY